MRRYVFRRLIEMAVALVVMSALVFALGRLTGDPVALLLSEYSTHEDRERLARELGFDRPIVEQYGIFIVNALHGDLGRSVAGDRRPVMAIIADRLPASLELAAVALAFSLAVGIPLGVLAAVRRGTALDFLARFLALLGQSAPVFWLGIVMIYFFSVRLRWLPTSGYGTWAHYVMPAAAMALFTIAAVTRLVRASMLEVLNSEFIKLARLKGLPEGVVVWRHALRNSLIPTVSFMGAFFATMITGAVVIETVFAWPGIGRLAYEAIIGRDFPLMQAIVLVMTALFIVANLAVDVAYVWLDPRIKYAAR